MGRVRKTSRRDWPANLHPNRDGYKYRHPITRKEHSMGKDKAKAFAAAKKLNALLIPGNDLVGRVLTPGETVADAIQVFRADDIPSRKWAPKTAEVYESVIRRIEAGLGATPVAEVTVKVCATFIREVTESERARQQFRLVLGWILACAVEEGWIDTNPALATRKFSHTRKRERLTIDDYRKIWNAAPQWVRNAMDLSLLTLLRREDVVSARFADVRDGALWVVPSKPRAPRTSACRSKPQGRSPTCWPAAAMLLCRPTSSTGYRRKRAPATCELRAESNTLRYCQSNCHAPSLQRAMPPASMLTTRRLSMRSEAWEELCSRKPAGRTSRSRRSWATVMWR